MMGRGEVLAESEDDGESDDEDQLGKISYFFRGMDE
jgi:hypothetical protein